MVLKLRSGRFAGGYSGNTPVHVAQRVGCSRDPRRVGSESGVSSGQSECEVECEDGGRRQQNENQPID